MRNTAAAIHNVTLWRYAMALAEGEAGSRGEGGAARVMPGNNNRAKTVLLITVHQNLVDVHLKTLSAFDCMQLSPLRANIYYILLPEATRLLCGCLSVGPLTGFELMWEMFGKEWFYCLPRAIPLSSTPF